MFRSFWATLYKAYRPTIQQNYKHLDYAITEVHTFFPKVLTLIVSTKYNDTKRNENKQMDKCNVNIKGYFT